MRQRLREATSRVVQRLNIAPGDVQGYQSITIRDITEEAGVSIGTFYKYFESRDDLAQALWSEPVDALKAKMQADLDNLSDPIEKLRSLLNNYLDFSVNHRRIFRAAFLFVRPEGHPLRASVKLEDEFFYTSIKSALEQGQADGQFRQFDSHQMAQTFWAGIHGALGLPENLERYEFDDSKDIAAHMIDSLLELISK